jgi:hypothetical protein
MNQLKFNSNNGSPCALNGVVLSWFTHWPLLLYLVVCMLYLDYWKDVEGYEGLYQVSNTEKVRSLDRYVKSRIGKRFAKGRVLKQMLGKFGYLTVYLCNKKGKKRKPVHRLVAQSFILNPNNYLEINHKNGIKTDNRVGNLEWCTRSQNMKHAYINGLKSNRGEKHSQAKLTEKQVVEIKSKIIQGCRNIDLAIEYNISAKNISNIKTSRRWAHI